MRSAHMMRQIAADEINVWDLNPHFVHKYIWADYCLKDVEAYGRVIQLQRRHGQLESSC